MAKTWSSHGSWNWSFLNLYHCAQGCSMPNFTILGVSHSPLFLEMAKIWPFYGQNMVVTWSFELVLPESLPMCPGMLHTKFQNSQCVPWSPFPRNGPNMALLWPKHGPHMVLQIGSSRILIIVPRDILCQISHCWVYPVVPFPRNGQNLALLGPKHGPQMVLQISSSWILINVPKDAPCQISES